MIMIRRVAIICIPPRVLGNRIGWQGMEMLVFFFVALILVGDHVSFCTVLSFSLCSSAIGLRCKDGVVFGVEKLVQSKLHEPAANRRIFNIDRHIGMVRPHLCQACWNAMDKMM